MRLFKKSLIPISRVRHEEDAINFRFSILSLFTALVIVKVYPIYYEYGKARLFKKSLIPISRVKHEEDAISFRFSILYLLTALVTVKVCPLACEYSEACNSFPARRVQHCAALFKLRALGRVAKEPITG
jgi:hypothetical protein